MPNFKPVELDYSTSSNRIFIMEECAKEVNNTRGIKGDTWAVLLLFEETNTV